ncbi:uncharacterized protein BT62DRAFT_880086 [Guyanagaster necrorhizus]|uniref:Hamartin n=1 Tax=Guyanagaster necrorhizus TaxID=856835 RepID=A0A9P8AYL6_9AGAR|nr:uncharacterized protein BT62DRAFT_880086 [Guyanagaster necrorhizus MCA 3950]KAG7452630.1 hypothetical protein BT62DRAFT_880086 [Guyanagaster necrorhizus MCA 3950]
MPLLLPVLFSEIRLVLEGSIGAPSLLELICAIDEFVHVVDQNSVSSADIEEELQSIHRDVADHSSSRQAEGFLAVLYHLRPLLSSASVILLWFDLILRPALREPKLSTNAIDNATDLIVSSLRNEDNAHQQKSDDFRRRIVDYYLLDAFNEGSGEDIISWAELDESEKDRRKYWKANLENILLKYGTQCPEELMTELHAQFVNPSLRLQILILLNLFTSSPGFRNSASILATYPLTSSIMTSLLIDNSTTACSVGLTLLVKLLPLLAVHACEKLKEMVPQLLLVLSRLICWKERVSVVDESNGSHVDIPQDFFNASPSHEIRPELHWERLESTFDAAAAPGPSPRRFFTFLYYLFPCNVLRFLRAPFAYLNDCRPESPYTVGWEALIDEIELKGKAEKLLREHQCHPLIIWRDAKDELTLPDFWAEYDVSRIASEAAMLDVNNTVLSLRAKLDETNATATYTPSERSVEDTPATSVHPIDLSSGVAKISLQDMIATSVALKSNLDINIAAPTSQWPGALFVSSTTPSTRNGDSSRPESVGSKSSDEIPSHIVQAISALQHELVLLKNELNFELWLSRENVQHIGRLYQERILSKNVEVERQGLYNKLRNYRTQVIGLERELREHKEQASSAKNKYAEWNTELQGKLRELRDEKKKWTMEAAALRTEAKEAKALFAAQGELLDNARKEVFMLQTQKKENQHKIDRLRDYEKQIQQHLKMQQLWFELVLCR